MTGTQALSAPEDAGAGLSIDARLDALRRESAWRLDPVQFRYLEAMARRTARQGEPVRALLAAKLDKALTNFAERLETAKAAGHGLRRAAPRSTA